MIENNQKLIQKAQQGCEDAFECIFKQYLPIVLSQKNKSFLRDYELDDWLQEGRIVCYKSLQRYDLSQNVTFGLFFKINFERWVVSAIRYQEAQKRQINRHLESLDERLEERGKKSDSIEIDYRANTSLEYVFVRENLEAFPTSLSSFEVQIYQCILEGEDVVSIAESLDVTQKKVICGYSRLRRKLKNHMFK